MTTLDQDRAHGDRARSGTDARAELATPLPLDKSPRAPEPSTVSSRAEQPRASTHGSHAEQPRAPTHGSHAEQPHASTPGSREARLSSEEPLDRRKLVALGTLASNIAHDFGNALQSITGNSALAQRCLEPGHPAHALLDEVARAGARAGDLVQRIVRFSRPDQPERRELSLHGALAAALEQLRATLPAQIVLRAQLADDVVASVADATQVHQLIFSLVGHATHAIVCAHPERAHGASATGGGAIDVWLGTTSLLAAPADVGHELPAGTYAVLHVSHDGAGVDPSTLARIFDPFSTSKPAGPDTSLSLTVVHGIMKGLGGALTVRSDLAGGSTFSLYFPSQQTLAKARTAQSASAAELGARTDAQPVLQTRTGRVLFVDDEQALLSLGTHMLEVLGYEVSSSALPLTALKLVAAEPLAYDAVVTDLSMPGLSGFQLTQQLLAVRVDLPVIVMSGYLGPEERALARKVGVRELLLKPVGMDDLHRTLTRVLSPIRRRTAVHKS